MSSQGKFGAGFGLFGSNSGAREPHQRPPSPTTSLFGQGTAAPRPPSGSAASAFGRSFELNVADLRSPSPTKALPGEPLPTDVAALQSMVNTLLAEVKATTSVNAHLAASVARLQASQSAPSTSTPTPSTTASSTPTPSTTANSTPTPTSINLPLQLPIDNPRTIASGRGCASPELFQKLIKKNWHGRLGRTHMADVDALSATALSELDCLIRRKLHANFPRGHGSVAPDADTIFASLAALGLRLEDRGAYADLPIANDNNELKDKPTIRRATNHAAWYISKGDWADYWRGVAQETMVELAKYRGLFDDEGFLKTE
ncbi:hypothetical protein DFP73DRAFT_543804 [Morchella snyderi]|nr:hypothetical protein DFP73DRAFT_543804 [Morchella snyderi]